MIIEEVMKKDIVTLTETDTILAAAKLINKEGYTVLWPSLPGFSS
ncbi:CBS domain-containing protein [Peribacillus cavernae]|nr:CBS domain-containing protein [Peribacillus cavernae]MDQ0221100.1 CBS domain-containing protein [Peribacillus cavernae]